MLQTDTFFHLSVSRQEALSIMTTGAIHISKRYEQEGRIHGVMGLGGSTSTSMVCEVMRGLKIGLPKFVVSTMASGDVRSYVGDSDICLMPSIGTFSSLRYRDPCLYNTMVYAVDISGALNSISERILTNACAAISGMAQSYYQNIEQLNHTLSRSSCEKTVAVTMFGLTTPGSSNTITFMQKLADNRLLDTPQVLPKLAGC
jgi:uncharacterized protein (UPF0261 family)